MNYEIIKELEKEQLKENAPQFSVGDTVRVHNRIKEGNRERIQIFEGTVLKIQGGGPRTTFTVRKDHIDTIHQFVQCKRMCKDDVSL